MIRLCRVLYLIALGAYLLYSLLFHGFTHWAVEEEVMIGPWRARMALLWFSYGLLGLLTALEFGLNRRRAAIAAALLLCRVLLPKSGQTILLVELALFCVLADRARTRAIAGCWLAVYAAYVLLLAALLLSGAVTSTYAWPKLGSFSVPGVSLGMGHPNSLALLILAMLLMAWYLWLKRSRAVTAILFAAAGLLIWYLTVCRTAALLALLFPLLETRLTTLRIRRPRQTLRWCAALPFMLLCVSLGLTLALGVLRLAPWLDNIFGGRFTLAAEGFHTYPLTLLGQTLGATPILDNLYINLLLGAGGVPTALFLGAMCVMNTRLAQAGDTELLSVAILYLILGLMENAGLYLIFGFAPLLAASQGPSTEG